MRKIEVGTMTRDRWLRPLFLATGLLLIMPACSRAASRGAPPSIAAMDPQPAGGGGTAASPTPRADRAMRITVETTVVVPRRDAAVSSLRALVVSFGGYVGEGTVSGADVGGSALFVVKVPAASVTEFRARLATFGEVTSDREKAEDVTEARADVKARLRNARAEDQRLLDLLANRTGNLGDVVLVEKELASVRESIERLEAEERTLEGQIAFATLTVHFDTVLVATSEGTTHRLGEAARDGVTAAKAFVLGLATASLEAGPTLLIMAAIGYALFRMARGWARRRRPPAG